MATPSRRVSGDIPAGSTGGFSYAQAAKGLSSAASQSSKTASGTITPKDSENLPVSGVDRAKSWADEMDTVKEKGDQTLSGSDAPSRQLQRQTDSGNEDEIVSSSVAENLAASASTLVEDDHTSIPNQTSELTWESKSQTSNKAEESSDIPKDEHSQGDASTSLDGIDGGGQLQEAPAPAVNIWSKRKEEAKAKTQTRKPTESVGLGLNISMKNGLSKQETKDFSKGGNARDQRADHNSQRLGKEDGRQRQMRREHNYEEHVGRSKKFGGKIPKEARSQPAQAPPSIQDQESWPSIDNAQVDDRRKNQEKNQEKSQDKTQKAEKDSISNTSPQPQSGKNKNWVHMDFIPSVLFNTPLPSTSRRPNRGGARGSRDGGRSQNGPAPNGTDRGHRSRGEGEARSLSPGIKGKRSVGEDSRTGRRDARAASGVGTKDASKGDFGMEDQPPRPHANNTFPRSYGKGKQRRQEVQVTGGEMRFDGAEKAETLVPIVNGAAVNGDSSRAHQLPQSTSDTSRKLSMTSEPTSVHGNRVMANDRRNGTYPIFPRDRPEPRRGSGRGGRGGPHHFGHGGHHLSNGTGPPNYHTMYPLPRSPTHTDPYFNPGSQAPRGYRGPGARNQPPHSADPNLGRFAYPANGLAPLNTFVAANYGPYDSMYPQTMSAYPHSDPQMESLAFLGQISHFLEYYFCVNNLCKDIHLRKHMNSQGWVLLNVVCQFKGLASLTEDAELVKYACQQSHNIEIAVGTDGQDRIRKREGWDKWVLPLEERVEAARLDHNIELRHSPFIPPQAVYHKLHLRSMSTRHPASAVVGTMPAANGLQWDMAQFSPFQSPNGNGQNGQMPLEWHSNGSGSVPNGMLMNDQSAFNGTGVLYPTAITNGDAAQVPQHAQSESPAKSTQRLDPTAPEITPNGFVSALE